MLGHFSGRLREKAIRDNENPFAFPDVEAGPVGHHRRRRRPPPLDLGFPDENHGVRAKDKHAAKAAALDHLERDAGFSQAGIESIEHRQGAVANLDRGLILIRVNLRGHLSTISRNWRNCSSSRCPCCTSRRRTTKSATSSSRSWWAIRLSSPRNSSRGIAPARYFKASTSKDAVISSINFTCASPDTTTPSKVPRRDRRLASSPTAPTGPKTASGPVPGLALCRDRAGNASSTPSAK